MSITDRERIRPLALTQGDPSGIGPDIALMAWMRRVPSTPAFAVVGDPATLKERAERIGLAVPLLETGFDDVEAVFDRALPIIPSGYRVLGRPGDPTPDDVPGTLASIDIALEAVRQGSAAALVTNPIAKSVLYAAGFPHPGHTEYLGTEALRLWGRDVTPVMMLWSETLAVVPVTIHIPLAAVPQHLTRDLIVATARVVEAELRTRFGIASPRLVCAGLNPHAGEGGSLGREEIETIGPALELLRSEGLAIEGPLSADTMFHAEARARYDVALTMYHDQGLIPIKTLSFDTGVNVTLGLPFVRTSPDHGTAFAIAGSGLARPNSLEAALALAARLARAPAPPL